MSKKKPALPKRIGGVKVPKAVRKGRLGALLASKAGQALIAEALMAAATLVIAKIAKDSPRVRTKAHDAADKVRDAGEVKVAKAGAASAALSHALAEGVRSFSEALRSGGPAEVDASPSPTPKPRPAPRGPLSGRAQATPADAGKAGAT